MDAGVRVRDGRSRPVNASRESSMLSTTRQRRAEVYRQNSQAYSQAYSQSSYPQNPQAGGQTPGASVENMAGPQTDAESESLQRPLAPPLPGDFLLAEYESDCARFVAEAKNLARRRMGRVLLAH